MPPLVPLFVVGFLTMVLTRTAFDTPAAVLSGVATAQTLLLCAAMFALGCRVRVTTLRASGAAPTLLAVAATTWIAVVGLLGPLLVT